MINRDEIDSALVRRLIAAQFPQWSDRPVTTVAVDGIVDLVVEEADGSLTIVDYKTDVAVTVDTVDEYLLQLCAYAELLGGTTGKTVRRIELVFCRGARPTVVARDLG